MAKRQISFLVIIYRYCYYCFVYWILYRSVSCLQSCFLIW